MDRPTLNPTILPYRTLSYILPRPTLDCMRSVRPLQEQGTRVHAVFKSFLDSHPNVEFDDDLVEGHHFQYYCVYSLVETCF